MIERKIQTEAFWHQEFAVTDQDMADLEELFLEEHRPMTVSELARSLVVSYCQREESLIQRQLAKGTVYRPNASFEIGEQLVFPHLEFALGTVVSVRDGHNPEYDDFKVVSVKFDDGKQGKQREFAAELKEPHKLAFSNESSWAEALVLSPDFLWDSYGKVVSARLVERFQSESDLVHFRGQWLPKDMAVDVHIGLLNIAEAMLDMQGHPLPPQQLLSELDLPKEVPERVKVFSLNTVMSQDKRFGDVGDDQQVVWGLRRWMPAAATAVPARLHYEPVPYDRTCLDVTHLQLEREIDDEASQLIAPPTAASATDLTLLLTYPHWRVGSLSLTARSEVFFPGGTADQRTQITFLDRANQKQFPGWVVHGHRYVFGLAEWYESNNIPVGAFVKLERTDDPHTVAIDFIPRRMQREWTRMIARNADGGLGLTMQKRPVACEYDDLCLLDEPDRAIGDALWQATQENDQPLDALIKSVFLELAKLTPIVTVHAKTLYVAVNVVKRCPPGLVFSTLFRRPEFVTTGDGYWVFQGEV